MTSEEKIKNILERAIEEKVFPGAVVGVIDSHLQRKIIAVGNFEYDSTSEEVKEDTLYDVASISKAVVVGLTALKLIEEGKLSPQDKVTTLLPEVTSKGAENAIIQNLLTYTYVLTKDPNHNYKSYEHESAETVLKYSFARDTEFVPGTSYKYSNIPALLLGMIIEKITGKKLYKAAKESVLDPLEMKSSTFHPAKSETIPPTEIISWRGKIQGTVHDEMSNILQSTGLDSGCSGLFANVPELLNVIEMQLGRGVFRGRQIFKEATVDLMDTNVLSDIHEWSGLGFELNQKFFMGDFSGERTFGKTGFTGTCIVIDRTKGRGFAMLSNATFPARPASRDKINEIRQAISNIVLNQNEQF